MDKYAVAVATWVGRKFKLDPSKISNVDFINYVAGYCETCGYETLGLEFKYDGKLQERELGYYDTSPGKFLEECSEILKELDR